MGKGEYESIICVDLRSFDRAAEDLGSMRTLSN